MRDVAQGVAEPVGDISTCVMSCAMKNYIGMTVEEAAWNANEMAWQSNAEKIGKAIGGEVCEKLVKLGGHLSTAYDTYGAATCTADCLKSKE